MGNKFTVDWAGADWRKQDVILAAEFGCSRERVRQARNDQRFGNGARPDRFRKRTIVTAVEKLEAMNTAGRTLPELARLAGCDKATASLLLRRLGKGFRRRPGGKAKYDWTRFPSDWASRTDAEIAAILGVPNPVIVTQWRIRHGHRRQARTTQGTSGLPTQPVEHMVVQVHPRTSPYRGQVYARVFAEAVAFGKGKVRDFVSATAQKLSLKESQVIFAVQVLRREKHQSNMGRSKDIAGERGVMHIVALPVIGDIAPQGR